MGSYSPWEIHQFDFLPQRISQWKTTPPSSPPAFQLPPGAWGIPVKGASPCFFSYILLLFLMIAPSLIFFFFFFFLKRTPSFPPTALPAVAQHVPASILAVIPPFPSDSSICWIKLLIAATEPKHADHAAGQMQNCTLAVSVE